MKTNRRLILGTGLGSTIPQPKQIPIIKHAGFDGAFINWTSREETLTAAEIAAKCGAAFTFVHAPFGKMAALWEVDKPARDEAIRELKDSLTDISDAGVTLAVLHVIIGMDKHTPTQEGLPYFGEIVAFAQAKGVRIAFENTEGDEYLDAVMDYFKNDENVGFCWDTGHELCYNGARDMMAKYGDRLFVTHLNDNNGQTGKNITWCDDSHFLPFDGIADWKDITSRLIRHHFDGDLTFELTMKAKPNREPRYDGLTLEDYVRKAFERAERFQAMMLL